MTTKSTRAQYALAGFALLGIAAAASPARAEFAGAPYNIREVGVAENGCLLITAPAGYYTPTGYLVVEPNMPGKNAMQSIALASLLSGKRIDMNRVVRAAGCYGIADHVTDIRIYP